MNNFTPGELEIMQILWQHDLLKPAEILERLGRPLTNPALRSALRVLMEKGHVTRQKQGKAYYYRARSAAPTAFRKMANRLADMFCGGSAFELIAQLIKNEKLSDDDIRQLQDLAKNRAGCDNCDETNEKETIMRGAWYELFVDMPAVWDLGLRVTLLLALAWLIHLSLLRGNPRWRVQLWRFASLGVLMLAVAAFLPKFVIAVTRTPQVSVAVSTAGGGLSPSKAGAGVASGGFPEINTMSIDGVWRSSLSAINLLR